MAPKAGWAMGKFWAQALTHGLVPPSIVTGGFVPSGGAPSPDPQINQGQTPPPPAGFTMTPVMIGVAIAVVVVVLLIRK